MKKRKGEVQQFFVQMICIIFSFAILLYSLYFLSTTISYNNINQVARKYILIMERNGYLEEKDVSDIKTKLEKDSNISSVNVEFENLGVEKKVKYGDPITIKIQCKMKVKRINFLNFELNTEANDEIVEVEKSSTARW